MNRVARIWLYFIALIFGIVGFTSLFSPETTGSQLQIQALSLAGTSELRGLYGGGFVGFALILIAGLRRKDYSQGLLMSMAIIMGGIVVGRVVSIALDHELKATLGAGAPELLVALACLSVYKHDKGLTHSI
jgi:hypothetical protein